MTVRRDSLAAILKLVEEGLLTHDDADDLDLTELQAALTELHTAMASLDNATNGTRNETKTETRGPPGPLSDHERHNLPEGKSPGQSGNSRWSRRGDSNP